MEIMNYFHEKFISKYVLWKQKCFLFRSLYIPLRKRPTLETFHSETFQVDTTPSNMLFVTLIKRNINQKNNMKSSSVNKSTVSVKENQKHSEQIHHYIKVF